MDIIFPKSKVMSSECERIGNWVTLSGRLVPAKTMLRKFGAREMK